MTSDLYVSVCVRVYFYHFYFAVYQQNSIIWHVQNQHRSVQRIISVDLMYTQLVVSVSCTAKP